MSIHLKMAMNMLDHEHTGQTMTLERGREVDLLRHRKLDRMDIFGKKIDPNENYMLATKTKPSQYYTGGAFSNPYTSDDPIDADFITGKELIDMEFHWGLAWIAIPVRRWEQTVRGI